MSKPPPKILYYCPSSLGGIANYAHEQAKALGEQGIKVAMLCPSDYPYQAEGYVQLRCLSPAAHKRRSRIASRLALIRAILRDPVTLDRTILEGDFRRVLFSSYSEYLAPLWAWRLRRHKSRGVVIGAVIHDPVRDYIVGPLWWHRRSVAAGYSFLSEGFIHDAIKLEGLPSGMNLPVTTIPHGPFDVAPTTMSQEQARALYGIPANAQVMIAFGYIRDTKNLDLVIGAMEQFPDFHLLVAGRVSTEGQRPISFYQDLATKVGVNQRCHWIERFIEPEEVGNLFLASDLVLLTYSKSFRSASGVLNVAAAYHKPCLASAGAGSLSSVVRQYGLGIWVEPDSLPALIAGLRGFEACPPSPKWMDYEAEQSWTRAVELILDRFNSHELAD
jgi:glycosyltransferase involved in cell wall biosynthesis